MTSDPNPKMIDSSLDELLNRYFSGKVVRKDLTKWVKEGANVPVYVLEYLLGTYCASNDEAVIDAGLQTVKKILAENYVRPDEAEKVKSVIRERGSLKIIDKVSVTLNEKRDVYEALLGNLGVKGIEVPSAIIKKYEKLLVGGIWSIVTLEYFFEESQKGSPFVLRDLKPIQMPNMDLEELFEGRRAFTEGQWIDVLLLSLIHIWNVPTCCGADFAAWRAAIVHRAGNGQPAAAPTAVLQERDSRCPGGWSVKHCKRTE